MDTFRDYLTGIENQQHRARMEEVLKWVADKFPNLKPKIAWNQPMFTDHGTFIIAFSEAKNHMAVAPERAGIDKFSADIIKSGYDHSKRLFRIPWNSPVDYTLLEKVIKFNIKDKAGYRAFWRKSD